MVLPYGCIDIIFRKDKLKEKGVLNRIINKYKPNKAHIDNEVILVACAMSAIGAEQETNILTSKYKLTYIKDDKAVDFVLVESFLGPCAKCDWIKHDFLKEDLIIDKTKYRKGTIYYEFVNQK